MNQLIKVLRQYTMPYSLYPPIILVLGQKLMSVKELDSRSDELFAENQVKTYA